MEGPVELHMRPGSYLVFRLLYNFLGEESQGCRLIISFGFAFLFLFP